MVRAVCFRDRGESLIDKVGNVFKGVEWEDTMLVNIADKTEGSVRDRETMETAESVVRNQYGFLER